MSNLLYNEPPLVVSPSLALAIGLNEAIILQQIHYWLKTSKHVHDGRKWIYNSYPEWQKQFPFWSEATVKRTIMSLEEKGLLISGNFNRMPLDRTKWYRIDYDALDKLCPPIGSNCTAGKVNLTRPSAQVGPTLPENTTETPLGETMDNSSDPFESHNQPMAGLPRATDGHQRAVDRASGGSAPDPVEEAAKHLYMGFMGGPVPMPRAKREREKWVQAAQRLLQRLPDGWEIRAACEAIDRWWVNTPKDDEFWTKMPCKDETLDLIARYYITYQQRLASSRQTSDGAPDDGEETVEVETMSPEEEAQRRAWDKLWGSTLGELELQMTKATFDTWVRQTQIVGHDGNGTYTVQAQNSFAMDWLENRLRQTVERTLGGILSKPVEVQFVLGDFVTKSN